MPNIPLFVFLFVLATALVAGLLVAWVRVSRNIKRVREAKAKKMKPEQALRNLLLNPPDRAYNRPGL